MKTTRMAALAAATAALAIALAGCTVMIPGGSMMGGASSEAAVADDVNMDDVMFTAMMIPHHQQAIEMSDLVLASDGVSEPVRQLAQQIKDAQAPEIELMQSWLDEWGMDMPDMGGMDHGNGMMSDDDMDALEAAEGAEIERLFLEQMIEHHEGAIEMAEDVIDDGINPDVRALAESIIESQTAEIAQMRELLGE